MSKRSALAAFLGTALGAVEGGYPLFDPMSRTQRLGQPDLGQPVSMRPRTTPYSFFGASSAAGGSCGVALHEPSATHQGFDELRHRERTGSLDRAEQRLERGESFRHVCLLAIASVQRAMCAAAIV